MPSLCLAPFKGGKSHTFPSAVEWQHCSGDLLLISEQSGRHSLCCVSQAICLHEQTQHMHVTWMSNVTACTAGGWCNSSGDVRQTERKIWTWEICTNRGTDQHSSNDSFSYFATFAFLNSAIMLKRLCNIVQTVPIKGCHHPQCTACLQTLFSIRHGAFLFS